MLTINDIKTYYPPSEQEMERSILREYMQAKILGAIFKSPHSIKLSFLGGTALRLMHGNPRFSEDLDFDNFGITSEDFAGIGEFVKNVLEKEGIDVELQTMSRHAFRCKLRFPRLLYENKLSPLQDEKILIQLDTLSHGYQYEPTRTNFTKFEVYSIVPSTPLPIVFAQKIYALFNRPRILGRDFFDITYMIGRGIKPDYGYTQYRLGLSTPQEIKEYVSQKAANLNFTELADDTSDLVSDKTQLGRVTNFIEIWNQTIL